MYKFSSVIMVASSILSFTTTCEAARDEEFKNKLFQSVKSSIAFEKLQGILPPGMVDATADIVSNAVDSGAAGQLGYGFMMGYSSGYCVKKVSKMIAFVVGGMFMALQALAYNGYANLDQEKIKNDVEKVMDLNRDGKIDHQDAKIAIERLNGALSFNMPAGGGFTAGLLMGLKSS